MWTGEERIQDLCEFPPEFLLNLKDTEARSLTGNGMHIAAVGIALLYIVAFSPALT